MGYAVVFLIGWWMGFGMFACLVIGKEEDE